jgi:hypothetical protein
MNSFNIRELQSLLQRKFFSDLVNTSTHKTFLDESIIGMRFKNNTNDVVYPNQSLYYTLNISHHPKSRNFNLQNLNYTESNSIFSAAQPKNIKTSPLHTTNWDL